MNDQLSELKARLRKAEEVLASGAGTERVSLAQAISRARRLVRREDRTRPPSDAFRTSVEQAEMLARASR